MSQRDAISDAIDPHDIATLRRAIDAIDDRLLPLIAERLALAAHLGRAKGSAAPDPAREAEIIARLAAAGAVPPDLVALIWRALFTASRRVQRGPGPLEPSKEDRP